VNPLGVVRNELPDRQGHCADIPTSVHLYCGQRLSSRQGDDNPGRTTCLLHGRERGHRLGAGQVSWSWHTISLECCAAFPGTAALLRLQSRLNRHLGLRLSRPLEACTCLAPPQPHTALTAAAWARCHAAASARQGVHRARLQRERRLAQPRKAGRRRQGAARAGQGGGRQRARVLSNRGRGRLGPGRLTHALPRAASHSRIPFKLEIRYKPIEATQSMLFAARAVRWWCMPCLA